MFKDKDKNTFQDLELNLKTLQELLQYTFIALCRLFNWNKTTHLTREAVEEYVFLKQNTLDIFSTSL